MAPTVAEQPAAAPPSAEQLMQEASQAHQAGETARALQLWRDAAASDPLSKEPWLRMAQLHFDRGDYGATITAAQEAWQRDANDATANGLLAVSGLRVSSGALARIHTDALTGSTRSEAESLARTLRDLLGTAVLVPPPPDPRPAPAPRVRPVKRPAVAASAPALATAPDAPRPAAATPARDPFGALR
jgi:hypothetical protein